MSQLLHINFVLFLVPSGLIALKLQSVFKTIPLTVFLELQFATMELTFSFCNLKAGTNGWSTSNHYPFTVTPHFSDPFIIDIGYSRQSWPHHPSSHNLPGHLQPRLPAPSPDHKVYQQALHSRHGLVYMAVAVCPSALFSGYYLRLDALGDCGVPSAQHQSLPLPAPPPLFLLLPMVCLLGFSPLPPTPPPPSTRVATYSTLEDVGDCRGEGGAGSGQSDCR